MQKHFLFLLALVASLSLMAQRPAQFWRTEQGTPDYSRSSLPSSQLVVLYDNDVHCYPDGYPVMAALADSLSATVVSCGDYLFGNTLGICSNGGYIARLMNVVGYNYLTLGNHEFEYSIPRLNQLIEAMEQSPTACRTLCCNMRHNANNAHCYPGYALHDYMIQESDGRYHPYRVAYVGVTTPSTLFTTSPRFFKGEDGEFCYNFASSDLISVVQRTVDQARSNGAQLVIVLSHLGDTDPLHNTPMLIAGTTGIDVVLDGHDHNTIPCRKLLNRNSDTVLLSSTGCYFKSIGQLTIDLPARRIHTRILSVDSLARAGVVSPSVADTLKTIRSEYHQQGSRKAFTSSVRLIARTTDGIRICRFQETNFGDLVSDAYRVVMHADIGWINGGGLRNSLPSGPLSYSDLIKVFPYRNQICCLSVTGQEVLDALEVSVHALPNSEGCFGQISGLRYQVDTTIVSPCQFDSNGVFLGVQGHRRVSRVLVMDNDQYVPLDPQRRYTIASTEYMLFNGGDGYSFPTGLPVDQPQRLDTDVLEEYVNDHLSGVVGSQYAEPQQRFVIQRPSWLHRLFGR